MYAPTLDVSVEQKVYKENEEIKNEVKVNGDEPIKFEIKGSSLALSLNALVTRIPENKSIHFFLSISNFNVFSSDAIFLITLASL